ncbi:MAG: glutathione peroxidase [Eubacteriales bacterium]|nr:glutathione peroxidase [Eubacteriales bacterium]
MSIYQYELEKADGEVLSLEQHRGKVLLIVNTATGCGFTPQYEQLEAMYEKYHEQGLEIIDIPCNQFGNQAPGNDEEIHSFCTLKYNTRFEQLKKAEVNGPNALPLYAYLKQQQPFTGFGKGMKALGLSLASKFMGKGSDQNDIKWNFTKFVVDRSGRVAARFEPTMDMDELEALVVRLLAE